MNTFNSELTNAESEVNFWRDFAYWWEAKHGEPLEPRILEAITNAEKRYSDVAARLGIIDKFKQ